MCVCVRCVCVVERGFTGYKSRPSERVCVCVRCVCVCG